MSQKQQNNALWFGPAKLNKVGTAVASDDKSADITDGKALFLFFTNHSHGQH